MPEIVELEAKLASLRRDVADAKRSGFTPNQLLALQRECLAIWAAIERFKYDNALDLAAIRQ